MLIIDKEQSNEVFEQIVCIWFAKSAGERFIDGFNTV